MNPAFVLIAAGILAFIMDEDGDTMEEKPPVKTVKTGKKKPVEKVVDPEPEKVVDDET